MLKCSGVELIIFCLDYLTVNDPTLTTPLNDSEKADLYSQLASGAESGWDYSSRFIREPLAGGSNNTNPALRTLNIKNHIPVDLNSILCVLSRRNVAMPFGLIVSIPCRSCPCHPRRLLHRAE